MMKATAHNTTYATADEVYRAISLLEVRIRHHEHLASNGDSHSAVYVEELREELADAKAEEEQIRLEEAASYHSFVDKSRRKPYLCGICGRDITDPYHQPRLFKAATYATVEAAIEAVEEIAPRRDERQMGLFTNSEMQRY